LAEAQTQGARRALWAIQLALGEAAAALGDQASSEGHLAQARETVEFIAEQSGNEQARENFLNLDGVRRLGA